MRHHREAALTVDRSDRVRQRTELRDLVLHEEREEMAPSRRDLDAWHHRDRTSPLGGEVAQHERSPDVVVIGERDDGHPGSLRRGQDHLGRVQAVAEVGVQLQIGPTQGAWAPWSGAGAGVGAPGAERRGAAERVSAREGFARLKQQERSGRTPPTPPEPRRCAAP